MVRQVNRFRMNHDYNTCALVPWSGSNNTSMVILTRRQVLPPTTTIFLVGSYPGTSVAWYSYSAKSQVWSISATWSRTSWNSLFVHPDFNYITSMI